MFGIALAGSNFNEQPAVASIRSQNQFFYTLRYSFPILCVAIFIFYFVHNLFIYILKITLKLPGYVLNKDNL
jgi:hypothetical protein